MFTHKEDGSEVEMKVMSDGGMVIRCPRCNTFWTGNLNVMKKESKTVEFIEVTSPFQAGITIPSFRAAKRQAGISAYVQPVSKLRQRTMMSAAKTAFPEAFLKKQ